MKPPRIEKMTFEMGERAEFVSSVRARIDPWRVIEVRVTQEELPWPQLRNRPHWSRLLRALARAMTALKEHWT